MSEDTLYSEIVETHQKLDNSMMLHREFRNNIAKLLKINPKDFVDSNWLEQGILDKLELMTKK